MDRELNEFHVARKLSDYFEEIPPLGYFSKHVAKYFFFLPYSHEFFIVIQAENGDCEIGKFMERAECFLDFLRHERKRGSMPRWANVDLPSPLVSLNIPDGLQYRFDAFRHARNNTLALMVDGRQPDIPVFSAEYLEICKVYGAFVLSHENGIS